MVMLSSEQVSRILEDLAVIKSDLREHMRRTKILEDEVNDLHDAHIKLKTTFMIMGWVVAAAIPVAQLLLKKWME